MSERDGYEHGVPCWIAGVFPDPERALAFYTRLFGWEAEDTMPPEAPGRYYLCRLRGDRDVAAIGSERGGGTPAAAAWGTHVWVDSADEATARAREAGGSVLAAPFDLLDAARVAVLADPEGAVFCVWQPGEHRGAQLVNEPGAWSMSALNARDPEKAKAFYGEVFGWESAAMDLGGAEVTMLRLPGYVGGEPQQPVPRDVIATLMALDSDASPDAPPHWSVDFWVDDVEASVALVAELGGEVVAPPYEIPGAPLKQAVVADPQGAVFSVTELVIPDAAG